MFLKQQYQYTTPLSFHFNFFSNISSNTFYGEVLFICITHLVPFWIAHQASTCCEPVSWLLWGKIRCVRLYCGYDLTVASAWSSCGSASVYHMDPLGDTELTLRCLLLCQYLFSGDVSMKQNHSSGHDAICFAGFHPSDVSIHTGLSCRWDTWSALAVRS